MRNHPRLALSVAVSVSGTGFSTTDSAAVYDDGTWARAGATPTNGQNTYTANATDGDGRTSQDTVAANLPSPVSFYYDGNGNLTNDGLRVFEYDTENQLIAVTVSNAWRSEFAYDGLMRRRIRKEFNWVAAHWMSTNEVRYTLDGFLVVQERSALNISTLSFTRGTDLSGTFQNAGGIGGMLALSESPSAHYYYSSDASGNITALLDARRTLVASYLYDPYGNTLFANGSKAALNLYRFSGKEQHPNSGTYYFTYRFYDPGLQRWVNRDPSHEQGGVNLYAAFRHNPVNSVDPYGECPLILPLLAGLGEFLGTDAVILAGGSVVAAGGGYLVGTALSGVGSPVASLPPGAYYGGGGGGVNAAPALIILTASSFPPGYWPLPSGAGEWGHRNGVPRKEAKRRAHRIKQDDNMSGSLDDYGVNPDTGEVCDPEGQPIGNLGD